jgi:hypothetical protein
VPALTAPQVFGLSEERACQLLQIHRGIQIPVQHQTALLAVQGPVRERQIRVDPPAATAVLAVVPTDLPGSLSTHTSRLCSVVAS